MGTGKFICCDSIYNFLNYHLVAFPQITSTLCTRDKRGYYIKCGLQLIPGGIVAEENFKIDTGCRVPVVITTDLQAKLNLPISGTKTMGFPSGLANMEYSETPLKISITTGRESIREYVALKTYIGSRNLLGKQALTNLGVSLPPGASEGVIYIFEVDDDTIG